MSAIRTTLTNEDIKRFPSPCYVLEESLLRRNLSLIKHVADEAGVEIILAFKAYALWKTFPIFREYITHTTASSVSEARLAYEEFGSKAHTYSPAYEERTFGKILECSSHVTFNSLSQWERFGAPCVSSGRAGKTLVTDEGREAQLLGTGEGREAQLLDTGEGREAQLLDTGLGDTGLGDTGLGDTKVSFGLRVNPEYSEIETALYNPCAPGSRFGVLAEDLPERLPEGIEGFHCHCHCEDDSYTLERTLSHLEEKFSKWFPQLKWLNLGGGHLMTRADYDVEHLIKVLKGLRSRYPWLKIILEPGSAFGWQTGPLISQVVDVVENRGIKTAILNVSFACHMPDCLEMPYHPAVRDAELVEDGSDGTNGTNGTNGSDGSNGSDESNESDGSNESNGANWCYRLGGNSCLSGDFMGSWRFDHELQVGDYVVFEDMLHYTTVKTHTFNGVSHPAIAMFKTDGSIEMLREFTYEDYKNRMD